MTTDAQNPTHTREQYAKQDYNILHQHVLNYQAGMESAGAEIVKSFHDFIYKYIVLIKYGQYKLSDSSTRRFLSLYTTSADVRRRDSQYKHRPSIGNSMIETVQYIKKLFSRIDEEELYQIIVLALLKMAKKYKDYDRPSFHNYVDKCLHFELHRAFSAYVDDPVARRASSNFEFDDEAFIKRMKIDEKASLDFTKTINLVEHSQKLQQSDAFVINEQGVTPYDDEMFNLNWFNGVTATGPFSELTPFERKIVYLSFQRKMQDIDIANMFGMCRATINRKKQVAVAKLKDANTRLSS